MTERETQCVKLAATGLANKEIAAELFVTVETVRTHLARVYKRLGVRSRTELAHWYLTRQGV